MLKTKGRASMKIDRLIGILALLLQQERVTAPQLARTFEVSRRTIQRDVEALCRAGIPLVTTQGQGGGISIMEGYRIDSTLLTSGDMQAILAGLRSLDSVSGTNRYAQLMEKLSPGASTLMPGSPDRNALRLRSKDPYDYACATRVFPESEKVRIHAAVLPRQNYFGRLEIDLTDGRGVCVYRVILDSDRTLKLKHGNGFTVAGVYGGELDMVWDVDCVERTVSFSMNGGEKMTWKFFSSAATVERLVFRTGKKRLAPYLDEDREFLPAEDLPGAGEMLIQESVYYITAFDTQAAE